VTCWRHFQRYRKVLINLMPIDTIHPKLIDRVLQLVTTPCPRVIGNITNEQIATLYETYQTDLTCNLDDFKREIARWRTRWSKTSRDQMPTSLCETLDAVNPVLCDLFVRNISYNTRKQILCIEAIY
jgi:hypothetical protein